MRTGTELPGYRLAGDLALGRLGPVVAAVRTADSRPVVVHFVGELRPSARARFLDQAGDLVELPAHPNIVPLLDFGAAGGHTGYLVTPRATGSVADRLLASGPMAPWRARQLARDAAAGLTALHAAGLLHGNVTPANVLLVPVAAGAPTDTAEPVFAVAPPLLPALVGRGREPAGAFRPPEVFAGEDWTVAADVYGLAATVFTALAGRAPHTDSADGAADPLRVLTGPVPELVRPDVPARWTGALRQGMAKRPGERPGSPRALADLFTGDVAPVASAGPEPVPGGHPVETRPPTAPLPVRPVAEDGRPLGSGYVLDRLIGRGTSGQVWRALRRDTGRPVAAKVLRSDLSDDPEYVTRFMRERAALTRLRHPNLVAVHDLVAEGGTLAIVMDLVDGADLRRALVEHPPARTDALRLLARVADALAVVHGAGIVHRDVKPENVLVERTAAGPVARLTDFGIARADGDPLLTRATRIMGTPAYLAPELAAGRPATPRRTSTRSASWRTRCSAARGRSTPTTPPPCCGRIWSGARQDRAACPTRCGHCWNACSPRSPGTVRAPPAPPGS